MGPRQEILLQLLVKDRSNNMLYAHFDAINCIYIILAGAPRRACDGKWLM